MTGGGDGRRASTRVADLADELWPDIVRSAASGRGRARVKGLVSWASRAQVDEELRAGLAR